MKAIVCTKYGSADVLKLMDVDRPTPEDNEVLVKIHATSVTSGDARVRRFISPLLLWIPMRLFLGVSKPRYAILGVEFAGEIEAVGRHVKRFKRGDQVYALNGMRFGAHAEYISMPEDGNIALKPKNTTYEEAAAIPFGGTTALHFFRKAKMKPGQNVLVYGASGSVGSSAIQLAKAMGADVTAVCSGTNSELVRRLGASHVIDYTKEDFARRGERYDVIFDAVGKTSRAVCKQALKPDGVFVTVNGQGMAKVTPEDLIYLKALTEEGKLQAVIDRRYPLEQIPDAHRYVEQGHKKGNVIITVS
ncbi:NAD(P)-dependent alcohol dehydrogenase [Paenibacillus guangzhouensis]|uniref:NAD(P)-dependent alcohol dehydrogenase n=1 Tax=Paenibacillus guangzhouensis TaxID=1473112 RepID=UPI001266E83D|nr:NAD(P)-dependent alcohol dehydrogenase [Paenibacillus guangzhouensis]